MRSVVENFRFEGLLRLFAILFILISFAFLQGMIDSLWLKGGISILMGIISSGMINLAHECLHQKFTSTRWLNSFVGRFSASILLVNFTVFKWHHLYHHRFVGTNKDTENNKDFISLSQYLIALSGLRLARKKISSSLAVLAQHYPFYINTAKRKKEAFQDGGIVLAILSVFCFLTILYPYSIVFLYWLPLLVAYSGIMFFAIPEHNGCKPMEGHYDLARSVYSNAFVRFFLWNGNFHAEHHLHPGASPYCLKKICHQEQQNIGYREMSYLCWHLRLCKTLMSRSSK